MCADISFDDFKIEPQKLHLPFCLFNTIKHANYDWNVLILNKELLFETLCELIFNRTNLFFYLTQKASTKTLAETRTFIKKLENQGLLIEKLMSSLLIHQEKE